MNGVQDFYEYSSLPLGGELIYQDTSSKRYTFRNVADFSKKWGVHHVFASAGTELTSVVSNSHKGRSLGYMPFRGKSFADIDLTLYQAYARSIQQNPMSIIDNTTNTLSYFSVLTYTYNNKYIANFNLRADGSNRFGQDKSARFLPIWSISGRWNVHHEKFAEKWKSAVTTVTDSISKMSQAISNFFKRDLNKAGTGTHIWDSIKNATAKFVDWISNLNIGDLLKDAVQIGGLAAVFAGIVKVLKSFENVGKSTEGVFKSVQGMFNSFGSIGQGLGNALGSVQGALKGFENDLKAKALIKIAGAIGILALSLLVLSLIPLTALAGSVGAMGASMAALVGGLTVMDKYAKDPKKVMMMAGALLIMAGAVFVMSIAAKYLAGVDTQSLIASSLAVITLLSAMVGMTRVMNGAGKKATKNVMLMLGMAIAVKILAKAVASIAELSPAQMASGTAVIVVLIGAMTAMTRLAGKGKGAKTGSLLKMVGVAAAVYILGKSVAELGSLKTNALIKGTVATSVIIGALTLFSRFSKIKGGFGQALTFVAIAGSVYLIGKTVAELGSLVRKRLAP